MRSISRFALLGLALLCLQSVTGCWRYDPNAADSNAPSPNTQPEQSGAPSTGSRNLALGVPSKATADEANETDYLLDRPEFAISYNRSRGGPNWVSWQVRKSDLGSVDRSNEFHPDPDLPAAWRINPGEYTGSGFDRGHVCPSGDRTNSKKANEATFSMANMLPQAANLNRETWGDLENFCRDVVRRGNDIYVVAGGYGAKSTIGKKGVVVPERCWKVIVVCKAGSSVPRDITANNPVIAVDFPNDESIEKDWKKYTTTIEAIEAKTGFAFLANVAPDVRAALRSKASAVTTEAASASGTERPRPAESARGAGPVIGNRKSKVYHLPDCPDYDQVTKENRVKFKSADDAERAGYRKAGNCP
jgi:endonuclease G, mitochondrial